MGETVVTSFRPSNPKGICSICGAKAWDGRATKCEIHKTPTQGSTRVPPPPPPSDNPGFKVDRGATTSAVPTGDKEKRIEVLKQSVLKDVNPMLIQGFAFICRPIPSEAFYSADGRLTAIGEKIPLAPWEAATFARAFVELEDSPVMKTASAVAKPYMGVAIAIGALGVAGFHGYQLLTIRDQLLRSFHAQMAERGEAPAEEETVTAPSTPPNGNTAGPVYEDGSPVTFVDFPTATNVAEG